jgi:Mn2+/Fe2+ NRAMP family transporter
MPFARAKPAFYPTKMLVWSGILQGFSTPPLMLLVLFMTNKPAIMGKHVNSLVINILGSLTTIVIFAATIGLVLSWFP